MKLEELIGNTPLIKLEQIPKRVSKSTASLKARILAAV